MGELPLPQSSPTLGTKREREADSPLSAGASDSPRNLLPQNEMPRTIAGSRRANKEPPFIRQADRPSLHKSSAQRPYFQPEPLSPPAHAFTLNTRPPPQEQSQQQSHSPLREIHEFEETFSATPPFTNASPVGFALPMYGRRASSDGQVTFGAQTLPSEPQAHSPQLDPQTNYWYSMPSSSSPPNSEHSEPTSHAGASGASLSYGFRYPPSPTSQHQPHPRRHYLRQGSQLGGFSSTSKISTLSRGPYGMDAAEVVAGKTFDSMTTAYTQQQQRTPTYTLGPMVPDIGSNSMVSPPPRSSSGSSLENAYSGMGMDTRPDPLEGHYQHPQQHRGVQQQHEHQHPFTADSDTGPIWSNDPTGFECVEFVLFRS